MPPSQELFRVSDGRPCHPPPARLAEVGSHAWEELGDEVGHLDNYADSGDTGDLMDRILSSYNRKLATPNKVEGRWQQEVRLYNVILRLIVEAINEDGDGKLVTLFGI